MAFNTDDGVVLYVDPKLALKQVFVFPLGEGLLSLWVTAVCPGSRPGSAMMINTSAMEAIDKSCLLVFMLGLSITFIRGILVGTVSYAPSYQFIFCNFAFSSG